MTIRQHKRLRLVESAAGGHPECMKGQGLLLILFLVITLPAMAQMNTAIEKPGLNSITFDSLVSEIEIRGVLRDDCGSPIVNANAKCVVNDVVRWKDVTDFDGMFRVKPMPADTVNLVFEYQGQQLAVAAIGTGTTSPHFMDVTMKIPKTDAAVRCGPRRCCYTSPIDFAYPGGHITYSGDMLW